MGDPGSKVARCLYEGAPAGLSLGSECLDGVFPILEDQDTETEWNELSTNFEEFESYAGVEEDEGAFETLQKYRQK